jgi:RsiW-degrading membrane proteinase PrsW (M82 family)
MIYGRNAINVLPAFIFFGCFAIPFSVLTFFFEMNSPKNVSIFQVAKLVMVGGAVSFLITFFLFDYFPLQKVYGAASAGIIEEIAKILIVIILAKASITCKHSYTLNGILYGAAVGTGFAAFESAGYALNAGLEMNSFAALNHLIVFRGLLSPFTHIVWTGIAGGAFWMAFREISDKKIIAAITNTRFLSLFVISVALHFLWNSDIIQLFKLPDGFYIIQMVILGIISWLVILRMLATGLNEIRQLSFVNKIS